MHPISSDCVPQDHYTVEVYLEQWDGFGIVFHTPSEQAALDQANKIWEMQPYGEDQGPVQVVDPNCEVIWMMG